MNYSQSPFTRRWPDLYQLPDAYVLRDHGPFTEGIELTMPTGRLVAHLIASTAQLDRELIRDRGRSGLAG